MNDFDFLVLVVYLICITYAIYKVINSFNDEFTIELDQGYLNQQLKEQNLSGSVDIKFKFEKRYEFDALKKLSISVSNKSQDYAMYVDWDHSSLTDLDDRSRRVTRLAPGSTLDLFQTQVFSVVAPGRTLKEDITAEDVLKRKGDSGSFEISTVLINLSEPSSKAPDKTKQRYQDFMERKRTLEFFLELVMRLVSPDSDFGIHRTHIRCKFIIKKLHWTAGLPWNPKN